MAAEINSFSENGLVISENSLTHDLKKKEGEAQKELISLIALLDQLKTALADRKEGKSGALDASFRGHFTESSHSQGTLGSSLAPSDKSTECPSEKQLATALASLQATLSTLQSQISSSQSEEVKNALQIEEGSIKTAIAQMQQFILLEQKIQSLENYVNSLTQDQQNWDKGIVTWTTGLGFWPFDGTTHVVNYPQEIGLQIQAYLKTNFGIDITKMGFATYPKFLHFHIAGTSFKIPDPMAGQIDFNKFPTMSSFFSAIETHVYSEAMQSMSKTIFGYENPAIAMVQKLLQSGDISNAQAQAMLEVIMQQMLQTLTLLTEAGTGGGKEGPSNVLVASMLSLMNDAVSQLQATLSKSSGHQSDQSTQIAKDFIMQAQANLQKAVDQYNKIYKQEHDHSFWSTFTRIVTVIVSIAIIAIACCTGQFEVAALVAVFLVLQQTGAMSKLADALSKGLQDIGLPPDVAKVLADVIIVVAMILLTLGAGAAAGATVAGGEAAAEVASAAVGSATTAVEDSMEIEMTEITQTASQTIGETAETATTEATAEATAEATTTQAAEETSTETSNALKRAFQNVVEKFSSFSKTTNAAIFAGTQTAMSTNLFQDSAVAIADATHMSESQKEALEIGMEVVGSLACMILGGLSMNGIASNVSRTTTVAQSIAKNLGPNFLKYFAIGTSISGGALELSAGSKKASIEFELADSERELGKDQATANMLQGYEKMTSQRMESSNQYFTQVLRKEGEIQSDVLKNEFAAEAAFAQILSQSV